MPITDIFVISGTSDELIISHQYIKRRKDNSLKSLLVKLKNRSLPPTWVEDGIHYHYIKRNDIYFISCSDGQTSNYIVVDVLTRLYHILKDMLGSINQQNLMSNILLVKEVLLEILDFGIPQLGTVKTIKPYIQSDCVPVVSTAFERQELTTITIKNNEVFLDVVENVSAVFHETGLISHCNITGSLELKACVPDNCEIKVCLGDGVLLQHGGDMGFGSGTVLKSWKLHQDVNGSEFDGNKVIKYTPQNRDCVLLTYMISEELPVNLPFRVFHKYKTSDRTTTIIFKLKSEISSKANIVKASLTVPVPNNIDRVTGQLSSSSHKYTFDNYKKILVWLLKGFSSQQEVVASFTLHSKDDASTVQLQDALLDFEVANYTSSGMTIKYLQVSGLETPPKRWIRYITVANSYLFKLS